MKTPGGQAATRPPGVLDPAGIYSSRQVLDPVTTLQSTSSSLGAVTLVQALTSETAAIRRRARKVLRMGNLTDQSRG